MIKQLLFLLSFLLAAQITMAQETSDKNLVKTFDTKQATSITFQCNQKSVQIARWDDALLRVELLVKANMPMQVLEQLVKAGRYTLESRFDENGDLIIFAPHIDKHVSVRGTDLKEEIVVFAKTPGAYQLIEGKTLQKKVDNVVVRSLKDNQEELKKLKRLDVPVETIIKFQSTYKVSNKTAFKPLKFGDLIMNEQELEIY